MIFDRFFSETSSYLKIHHQTPSRAEPKPPMDWFHEYFDPLITLWLPDLWPVALHYVPEGHQKIAQSTLTKFQKVDVQTRDRRVGMWSRAQNTHKTNRLGVWFWFLRYGPHSENFGILPYKILWPNFCLVRLISQNLPPDTSSSWTKTPNESLLWTFWAPDDPLTRRPLVCGSLFWFLKGVIFENFPSVDLSKRRCTGCNSRS